MTPATRRTIATVLLLFTLLSGALCAAETPAKLFAPFKANSAAAVDHSPWAELLGSYLDENHSSGINRFDYAAVTPEHRSTLESYIQALEEVDTAEFSRDEQMAYWINFYNALTVRVILDAYPLASIRDISLPESRRGPWKAKLVRVQGTRLSLDDMEHAILRPIWADPRIHYAVNCASLGCPNLAPRPYTAENLEGMLDEAARSYVNHPRGVSADGRRLRISSIYNWYAEDFGGKNGLESHLLRFADSDTAALIEAATGGYRYAYDWTLNEAD